MSKIQRTSCVFRWFFTVIFLILPTLLIVSWIIAPQAISLGTISISFLPNGIEILHPLGASTKFWGFLISLIPTGIKMLTLYFLIRLFKLYETGKIFSLKNVSYIKKIGYTMLLGQLIHPIYQLLISATLTWHNPPGHRIAKVLVTGSSFGVIFTALLIILVSWIMAEGYKLEEEQQYTI